jgi:hypothetical protein
VGVNRVSVTAKFSEYDAGIPKDIVVAATRIAASLLESAGNVGNIQSEELEGHKITYGSNQIQNSAFNDPIVKMILEQRRDVLLG